MGTIRGAVWSLGNSASGRKSVAESTLALNATAVVIVNLDASHVTHESERFGVAYISRQDPIRPEGRPRSAQRAA